jgi:hypothetical protein
MLLPADVVPALALQSGQLRFDQFADGFRVLSFLEFLPDLINVLLLAGVAHYALHVLIDSIDCVFLTNLVLLFTASKDGPVLV